MEHAVHHAFELPDHAVAALSRLIDLADESTLREIATDITACGALCQAITDQEGQLSEDESAFVQAFLGEVVSLSGENAGDAACTLGAMYYCGRLTADGEPDYDLAFKYYTMGSNLGNMQALVNLGYCHLYGRSVPRSPEKAFTCFQRAAFLTNMPEALYKLGDMYSRGIHVEQDDELAFGLYRKALDMVEENPDEAPEIKASVFHRVADHISTLKQEDEPARERRERVLKALELYQRAERDYFRAIDAGAYYYDRKLDEVIAAEGRMRSELLRR